MVQLGNAECSPEKNVQKRPEKSVQKTLFSLVP